MRWNRPCNEWRRAADSLRMPPDSQERAERFTRHWTSAQPAVAAYLAAHLPDFRDAQDLLQTVAVVCLRKFDDYDAQRPFVAWALGVARFEALHHRRGCARSRLVLGLELDDALAAACEELSAEFERRTSALRTCLQDLDAQAARLIRLRYEEALGPSEIAGRTGLTAGAVRVALHRIRAAIRRCIDHKLRTTTP